MLKKHFYCDNGFEISKLEKEISMLLKIAKFAVEFIVSRRLYVDFENWVGRKDPEFLEDLKRFVVKEGK